MSKMAWFDPILYHYDTAGRMGREEYYADGELRSYLIYQYGGAAQAVRSTAILQMGC